MTPDTLEIPDHKEITMAKSRFVVIDTYKDGIPAVDSQGESQPDKGFENAAQAAEWFTEANILHLHEGALDAEGSRYLISTL